MSSPSPSPVTSPWQLGMGHRECSQHRNRCCKPSKVSSLSSSLFKQELASYVGGSNADCWFLFCFVFNFEFMYFFVFSLNQDLAFKFRLVLNLWHFWFRSLSTEAMVCASSALTFWRQELLLFRWLEWLLSAVNLSPGSEVLFLFCFKLYKNYEVCMRVCVLVGIFQYLNCGFLRQCNKLNQAELENKGAGLIWAKHSLVISGERRKRNRMAGVGTGV